MGELSGGLSSVYATQYSQTTDAVKDNTANSKTSKVSGKTIGKPELSENAAKYYEDLKKKYSNMDFILVSESEKENAKSQAGNYANANKMVVLIDEDKIEKMASDDNYRKQYEGVIANAASGLSQLSSGLSATGASIKGYGMQINDNGTASYFAVIDKSLSAQKDRIEKKAEDKKEAKKTADKKAQKEKVEDRLKDKRAEKSDGDQVTVTASSIEELLKKIDDITFADKSDNVKTDDEKRVGQNVDFKI